MDSSSAEGALLEVLGGWSAGHGPLSRKLARAIRRAIDDGGYMPGERLPSERRMADLLAVSRTTVVAAYDTLRAQGLLDSRRGSGTRVSRRMAPPPTDGRVPGGRATTIFQRLIEGPSDVISLACAAQEGDLELAEIVREVVDEDLAALLTDPGYRPSGLPALREAIAGHLTATGLPTAPDQILVTNGAHQALTLITQLYVRRGATVVVESPSWPGCIDIFRDAGAQLAGVPLDDEGIHPGPLSEAMATGSPALVFTMPTYHNPTGVLMSHRRRRATAEIIARHEVTVVEDHAYTALAGTDDDSQVPAPLAAYVSGQTEVLTLGSLGKAIWGGLRVGWVRGPAVIIERLTRRRALSDLGGPVLDQAIATRLLQRYPGLLARRSRQLRERLTLLENLLHEHLPTWRWRRPDGGAALWVRLPRSDATIFSQVALRYGVEVVPGSAMDPDDRHDDHIRIPFTFQPPALTELVHRLARAWTELQRHGPSNTGTLDPIV